MKTKITKLLNSTNLKNVELGFSLCASSYDDYDESIKVLLVQYPIFCMRYQLEQEYTQALDMINLSYQGLQKLPPEVTLFSKLNVMLLHDNHLEELPKNIGKLQNVSYMVLENNQLTSLPASIAQMQELSDLSLAANKFTSLPQVLTECKSLENLDLSENPISTNQQSIIRKQLPHCQIHF